MTVYVAMRMSTDIDWSSPEWPEVRLFGTHRAAVDWLVDVMGLDDDESERQKVVVELGRSNDAEAFDGELKLCILQMEVPR